MDDSRGGLEHHFPNQISKRTHFCAAHAVSELYVVMPHLPARPRITPEQGLLFVENIRDYLSVITLSAAEQFEAATGAARRGLSDPKVGDLLTLKCALKAATGPIYTLNPQEFSRLMPDSLREKLATVS
jgi:hypothetical protein